MGTLKGKITIKLFKRYSRLKKSLDGKIISGHSTIFSAQIGVEEEEIKKYVRYQETQERRVEDKTGTIWFLTYSPLWGQPKATF